MLACRECSNPQLSANQHVAMHSHAFAIERTVYAYPRQVIKCRGMHRLYPRIIFLFRARSSGADIRNAHARNWMRRDKGSNFLKIWVIRFSQKRGRLLANARRVSLYDFNIIRVTAPGYIRILYNWDAGSWFDNSNESSLFPLLL